MTTQALTQTGQTKALGRTFDPAQAAAVAFAALAPNTRTAYQGALTRFTEWLNSEGVSISDWSVARYAEHLAESGKSPATIALAVAAIKAAAKASGQPNPAGTVTAAKLRTIRREHSQRGRGQAAGLQWSEADLMAAVAANSGHSLAGLRDAALIATMSDAMLRVSELVALDAGDVTAEYDGSGRVRIRRSKTDQNAEGAVQYVGKPTMQRIRRWQDAAGITEGALFRRVRRGGHLGTGRLAPKSVRSILRKRARAADLDTAKVSGHSLRVGSAQSLVAAGASLPALQQVGRWKDAKMPARYARNQLAGKTAMARFRYGK